MHDDLKEIIRQFNISDGNISLSEITDGNINDTFLVKCSSSRGDELYVLQRINHKVFVRPDLVANNIRIIIDHIQERLDSINPEKYGRRIEFPRFIPGNQGDCVQDSQGNSWRMISYVDHTKTYQKIDSKQQAQETGFMLGLFHSLVRDLDQNRLSNTLKNFHITPVYLDHYDGVVAGNPISEKDSKTQQCFDFIEQRRSIVGLLEEKRKEGVLSLQPIHGDPKINNILFDSFSEKAVCMIDLDTTGVGLVLADLADCFRSSCNVAGEETMDPEGVCFDLDLMKVILKSYLSVGKRQLIEGDFDYLYDASRLFAFELGLRFFTDYLEGDVYFKTINPDHNLRRALVQFNLCRDIENKEKAFKAIVQTLR